MSTNPTHPELDRITSGIAPTVYFEKINAFGISYGVVRVTLEIVRHHIDNDGQLFNTRAEVAHLRMPAESAKMLRDAITNALLLGTPSPSATQN